VTGEPARDGAELAAAEINENDGIGGRDVEIINRDTELDSDTSVTRARELVQNEDVDVLAGILSSAVAKAVAEFAHSADVPLIVSMAQTPDITGEGCRPTTFRTSTNVDQFAAGLAQTVVDNLDVSRMAGVNPDYTFGQQMWSKFTNELQSRSSDIEIVEELFPALGKGNYQNEIQQLIDSDADGVMTSMFGGDVISFIQQGYEFDFFQEVDEFIQGSGAILDTARSLGEETPQGIANTHYFPGFPDTDMEQAFVDSFVEETDSYPTGGAQEAYSSIYALKGAIEETGSTSTDDMIDGLEGLKWEAPEGTKKMRAQDHECEQTIWQGRLGQVEFLDFPGITEMFGKDLMPEADATCGE